MKGIVGKVVLYFIFAVIVYMGVSSLTSNALPPDSSSMVATVFAIIAFVGTLTLDLIFNRKKKEKK
jgi:hypothetical protein